MKMYLDTEYFLKNKLTIGEVLYILMLHNNCSIEAAQQELINKGYITQDGNISKEFRITNEGIDALNNIIYSSKPCETLEEQPIEKFANSLRELFPKGYKNNTRHSWRGTTKDIVDKLKKFYFVYGDKYSREEIYNATKTYVETMKDDPYMRTLKYFIFKRDLNQGVEVSDLADLLENGTEDLTPNDWQNNMI